MVIQENGLILRRFILKYSEMTGYEAWNLLSKSSAEKDKLSYLHRVHSAITLAEFVPKHLIH